MKLVFMGTPQFVVPVLESLLDYPDGEMEGVYTAPDRPRGRGQHSEITPVKEFALDRDLPLFQPATLRGATVQQELAGLAPEVIVVAAYGRFLPTPILELPRYGCLNLHPSLLPRHRGPAPVVTSLLEGDQTTGVTLMQLDEGMDTGPIIAQREYPIDPEATAESLTAALFRLGAELLVESLPRWVKGELTAQPQKEALATITRKVERSDGVADWSRSAVELQRRHRAYTPWPGLYTTWQSKLLKLLDVVALPFDTIPDLPPGTVFPLEEPDAALGIITGNGVLGLRSLQLEGRRATKSAEFRRGFPQFINAQL